MEPLKMRQPQGGKTQLDKKVRIIETADGVQVQVYRLVEVQKEINGEVRTVEEMAVGNN